MIAWRAFAGWVSGSTPLLTLSCALLVAGCGGGAQGGAIAMASASQDDTDAVQSAVDRGGVVNFSARTYYLSRTIVIRNSGTIIQGSGPQTVFQFRASAVRQQCVNDRVFTTPCGIYARPARRIAKPISIGDSSFSATAATDVSDLQAGDWLLINDMDSVIGDRVTADWAQVESVSGLVVSVRTPFRTAFTNMREWNPGHGGLGFQRIAPLVENVEFRNFNISVPDNGPDSAAVGICVVNALHVTIDHVLSESFNAQPLYSYLSKDLTITNSEGRGHSTLSEFAATVDVIFRNNHFSEDNSAGLGLDLGTAFFDVSGNYVDMSSNIGAYLLYGVHDGTFADNQIAFVASSAGGSSAFGMLVWGTQNITVSGNNLVGGAGPQSTGLSVRSIAGEIGMPSVNVQLVGNTFGSGWVLDYEAGTKPGK